MIEMRWVYVADNFEQNKCCVLESTYNGVRGRVMKLQYRQKPEKPCELFYDPTVDTVWGEWQDVAVPAS